MDDRQVLFVGEPGRLWIDLSRCMEDEDLTNVRQASPRAHPDRHMLRHADAIIIGPDIRGSELLGLCRAIRAGSLAQITVISGELDEIDEMRLVMAGASTICYLPIRPRVVAAQLANQIDRHRLEATGDMLSYRKLEVYPSEHRVAIDGRPLKLTKTEFDLLEFMMGAPRRVHTHEQLCRWLWDDSWAVDHHRLEAHVSRLRKKVDAADGPPIIASVRGVGYRLIPDELSLQY